MDEPRSEIGPARKCYLCGERQPERDTEVTRYEVPSAMRGGTIQGVNRYVRMCRVGCGCKATTATPSGRTTHAPGVGE